MLITSIFVAAISTSMIAGSPLARRSDYTTCLDICSGDYSECIDTTGEEPVEVEGIIFECNAQALACQLAVCATTQDIEEVINNGLPAVEQLLEAAGAKKIWM